MMNNSGYKLSITGHCQSIGSSSKETTSNYIIAIISLETHSPVSCFRVPSVTKQDFTEEKFVSMGGLVFDISQ